MLRMVYQQNPVRPGGLAASTTVRTFEQIRIHGQYVIGQVMSVSRQRSHQYDQLGHPAHNAMPGAQLKKLMRP